MSKMRLSKPIGQSLALIMLACALFSVAPVNRATTVPLPVTSSAASPTPTPSEPKQPNALQRFFSWVGRTITHPFRRRVPQIVDPPIVSITASPSLIMGCRPFHSSEPCSGEREVNLYADAQSPGGGNLEFNWTVTAGRLKHKGRKVVWDISSLGEGTYTAMVDVKYANDRTVSRSTVIRILPCAMCDPPPCPTVSVSCPSEAESKHDVEFRASLAGGDVTLRPTYKWSVSAGRISSGQKTSKITVNVSDLAGKPVTATVTIGGVDKKCTGTVASCTVLDIR